MSSKQPVVSSVLVSLTLFTALSIMVVYILVVCKNLLLPIIAALILAYILRAVLEATQHVPIINKCPRAIRNIFLIVCFLLFFGAVVVLGTSTVNQLIASGPEYQEGLNELVARVSAFLGLETSDAWANIRSATMDRIKIESILSFAFSSATATGSALFFIAIYTSFLIAESATFAEKLNRAFGSEMRAGETQSIIRDINAKIGTYLWTKTLINIALAVVSYLIMVFMGVDHALVWAILIGLLNYIPYVGSLLGVAAPIVLCLVQYVSISATLTLLFLLTSAQLIFGNYIEPRVVGKQVNLSPFVTLVALSFWTTIWGLPGAILSIPMMSILTTILAAFSGTRFIAVLLSDGDIN